MEISVLSLSTQEASATLARMEVKPHPPAVVCCAPMVLINSGQPQEDKMSCGSCGCAGGRRVVQRHLRSPQLVAVSLLPFVLS